ncbi:hypothetical protein [Nocardiopsis metallicus]|uniref:Uncharacterized protein n=2 Tax=Nocardiopsis metallicus TaxID=179819 RepID=A0A840WLK0_9ACTN|nr:hypothetical protein [Nocardiopsis metallicus]MBB5492537.1 hypothetical protein [Nocardiopsis metallicus]
MQDSQTSPMSSAARPFSVVPPPRQSLLAARRAGVRPPQDVRQTCVLMFVTAVAYVGLGYQAWTMLEAGAPGPVVTDLWILLVVSGLTALGMAALALPVRRAGHVLWRSAQFGALVALGAAVSALHMSARLADTQMLLVGLLVSFFAIIVNIALWSTNVRRWCEL